MVLAGILASTMSTADSQLLAAASSMSHDLIQDFFGLKLSPKAAMHAARGTVIGIAIVAIFLAWDPNSTVFNIVSFAWAGFGASFGPLVLFSLFWKRTNKYRGHLRHDRNGAMVFIWKYLIAPWAAPGASTSCSPPSWWAASSSWWSPGHRAPPQEIVEEFEAVGK